jgi:eukaryotic-like serine/threonine-protein kinase
VAVPSSPDASDANPAERFQRLCELGSSPTPNWAALETLPDGRKRLVVLEQASRGGDVDNGEIADWVRDSQRLATLEHPNLARVRDVVVRNDDVVVVSDFSDGVRWAELSSGPQPVPLEIALRVFVDALSGLSAIHNVRDAKREPLKLVHGGLTTDCIVVGLDGVSRVVAASRLRSAARPLRTGSEYLAPEVLLADDAADARADVYSIGVMLGEALNGRPLFPNTQPSAILTTLLSGRVPRAEAPKGSPWAAPLVDVVSRALSVDPEKRFASASAMAAELRRIAGVKLLPSLRVAALVRAGFGERIRARRERLERGETSPPKAPPAPVREQPKETPVDLEGPSSSGPTPVPPPLTTTRPPPPIEVVSAFESVPVVMSSEPPTQPRTRTVDGATEAPVIPAAMVVPASPLVPRELLPTSDAPVVQTTPVPVAPAAAIAPAPVDPAGDVVHVTPRRSRALVYAAVGGPLVLALVGLLAWLGMRETAPSGAAAAESVALPTPATPVSSEVAKTVPLPEATVQAPAEPIASASAAQAEVPAAPPPPAAIAPPPPPAAPVKPRTIIKYDPQGI